MISVNKSNSHRHLARIDSTANLDRNTRRCVARRRAYNVEYFGNEKRREYALILSGNIHAVFRSRIKRIYLYTYVTYNMYEYNIDMWINPIQASPS